MTKVDLTSHGVLGVRADNPGVFTLTGTNTWIVGRDPAWLIDPGPALDAHVASVADQLQERGGLGGIAVTHDHADHVGALPEIRRRFASAPVAAARGDVDVHLDDGDRFGPLEVIATPGHAPDHLAYLSGPVAFTGDAVLGEGSVFIAPDPGALVGYLQGLRQLRAREPAVLAPGHGPPVSDPRAKLDEYIAHRLDRERRLLEVLDAGARSIEEMLDGAWGEVPAHLRPAATVVLAAHLDKLDGEGRVPADVQRPSGDALVPSEPQG